MNEFINAITSEPVQGKRLHFELPDGNVGITAWYPKDSDVFDSIIQEAESNGHKLIKEELENEMG